MIGLLVRAITALLAVGGVATVVVVTASEQNSVDRAVVTHIVDGDTIDIARSGRTERVRLLNIDTPETVDPGQPVQCMGSEASAFLASLVPVGSTVRLEYDKQRTDSYGRTLAGVFTADGTFVNAEIVRAGLAAIGVVGGNDRFYPEIQEAALSARREARGLYAADVQCTIPGQIADLAAAVASAPTAAGQPTTVRAAQLDAATAEVGSVLASAIALADLLAGEPLRPLLAVFTHAELDRFVSDLDAARGNLEREHAALRGAAEEARTREAEAVRRAEAEAAGRGEADAAAAREAEERQKSEMNRASSSGGSSRSDVSGRPPQPRPRPAPAPAPEPDLPAPSGATGNPYPGYTGPRCYDPGGVTWRPCPERG